jgi:ATP/ADP translocase
MVKKILKSRYLIMFMACLLLFAIIFHAIEIHHEHAEEIFGNDEQKAFLHGGDKKYWFAVLLGLIAIVAGTIFSIFNRRKYIDNGQVSYSISIYFLLVASKIVDPVREALRRGILNPKLCE